MRRGPPNFRCRARRGGGPWGNTSRTVCESNLAYHIAAVAKQIGASIKLVGYTRFEKGEGIEKRQDDLAEEVAKLVK